MMPEADGGRTELADNHDDVDISREHISGTFEFEVSVPTETLDDVEEQSHMSAEDFAERLAVSRFNKELDPTHSVDANDAMAKEESDWSMNGERRFTVWVRFDKND